MPDIHYLYESLQQRRRPEDVADAIMSMVGDELSKSEKRTLEKAAKGALSRTVGSYTSMAQTFAEAAGAGKQVKKAIELFKLDLPIRSYDEVNHISDFINMVSPLVGKEVGSNNFQADRLNKEQREAQGMDISKRAYNKRWRLLKRLEKKLQKFILQLRKNEFQLISKHGLAHRINYVDFCQDINSACFIAYFNARCNLRSQFTFFGQEHPFDEICEMLLKHCNGTANWWAIAHIYATQAVLSRITDEQKGLLIGEWTTVLQDIGALLAEVWAKSDINKATMIVQKGNDSTTWNNTAGAWNKARDNWLDLIFALGMEELLDDFCFGKVMRLMAGDVAYVHSALENGLDPNTSIWNALPLPWEVINGQAGCNRAMMVEECKKAKVDPKKSGWIAPRERTIVKFSPTPELVHGVVVSNPFLATVFKKHKYFSGKNAKFFDPGNN